MSIIPHYSRIKYQKIFEMGRMRLMGKPWISGVLLMTCVVIAMLLPIFHRRSISITLS